MEITERGGRYYKREDSSSMPEEISPTEFAQISTAKDTGPMESVAIGAGRTVSNILQGIGLSDGAEGGDGAMGALREENPVSTFIGETAPTMMGPMKAGIAANAGYNAGMGYLSSADDNRVSGAVLGSAGGTLGDMAGRVFGRIKNAITIKGGETGKVAGELKDAGYKLTPAQESGSQTLMKVERGLEKNPYLQKYAGEMGEHNQELLLSRANESIGMPGNAGPLDRNAREIAAGQIGQRMEAAADGVSVTVPESLAARVSRIVKNDDMLEIPELPGGGNVSGVDYMRIRSDLARAQRSAQGSAKDYISKTLTEMDDEFLKAAGPEQAAAYRVAREQYKNLVQLEKGAALSSDGLVNPRSAKNAFKSKQGYGARGVDNTLPETQSLIRDIDNLSGQGVNPMIGNSGTPEGLGSMLNPATMLEGAAGHGYYSGKWGTPGLLTPAGETGIGLGRNIGRGGLLSTQE